MINGYVFALLLIAMAMGFVWLMASDRVRRTDKRYSQEDAELMQELHRGLQRMEQRIEALETLLLERTEREARSGTHDRWDL